MLQLIVRKPLVDIIWIQIEVFSQYIMISEDDEILASYRQIKVDFSRLSGKPLI